MNQPPESKDLPAQQKAQELLEEREADFRMRVYTGPMNRLLIILLCVWTCFQLYFTTWGAISAINLRAFHCMFLLLFTFLLFPAYRREKRKRSLPPLFDIALIAISSGSLFYLVVNYPRIAQQGGRVTSFELVIAGAALLAIFEAARRASGNLTLLALLFLAYNWFGAYLPGYLGHNGFTLKRVLVTQFWGTQGVLGTGIGVSATYISLCTVRRFSKAQRLLPVYQRFFPDARRTDLGRSGEGRGSGFSAPWHD